MWLYMLSWPVSDPQRLHCTPFRPQAGANTPFRIYVEVKQITVAVSPTRVTISGQLATSHGSTTVQKAQERR